LQEFLGRLADVLPHEVGVRLKTAVGNDRRTAAPSLRLISLRRDDADAVPALHDKLACANAPVHDTAKLLQVGGEMPKHDVAGAAFPVEAGPPRHWW
jgi:hypothetical protein